MLAEERRPNDGCYVCCMCFGAPEVDCVWDKLDKNSRRLLNCFLFTIMSPVGFLLGWYAATEQWAIVIVLMGATMTLDFIGSYTYMDIIGDRFENELEKARRRHG